MDSIAHLDISWLLAGRPDFKTGGPKSFLNKLQEKQNIVFIYLNILYYFLNLSILILKLNLAGLKTKNRREFRRFFGSVGQDTLTEAPTMQPFSYASFYWLWSCSMRSDIQAIHRPANASNPLHSDLRPPREKVIAHRHVQP
jgi:hypothetical protein